MYFRHGVHSTESFGNKRFRHSILLQTTCCATLFFGSAQDVFAATPNTLHPDTEKVTSGSRPLLRRSKAPHAVRASTQAETLSVTGKSRTTRKDAVLQKTPSSATLMSAERLDRLGA